MSTARFKTLPDLNESSVAETVKHVNAQALDLLSRRTEINRRIRHLHQVMKGLRDLANKAACNASDETLATCAPDRNWLDENRIPRAPASSESRPHAGSRSRNQIEELTRACRIALMEGEGTASTDEIRRRIIRRGSFSFADSKLAETSILESLQAMINGGEVRQV
ncbi:MAG: hypothetical protein WAN03_02030, partial [Candidatus Sulfotelmatobacter sp.]